MIDLAKAQVFDVLVEGVRVSVCRDEHGNLVRLSTATWVGGDLERLTNLALIAVQQAVYRNAEAVKHALRTAESATTRREAAQAHWSREWLEAAHRAHPDYGTQRLVQAARKLIALNGRDKPEYAKRDEITPHRAKAFLKEVRSK